MPHNRQQVCVPAAAAETSLHISLSSKSHLSYTCSDSVYFWSQENTSENSPAQWILLGPTCPQRAVEH